MKALLTTFILLFATTSFAKTYKEFRIPTKDRKSFLTGQFDLPLPQCGSGPYKTVMIVSGSGWSYRDGLMGRSGVEAEYIYKYMAKYLTKQCYLVVRWDYRGVSCDRKQASDVQKCINQKVRSEMDHRSMLEDIESVYNTAIQFPLVDRANFKMIGHSEGSLNISTLISENRIHPKGLVLMGAMTESPKSIFYWQSVTRITEYLMTLDKNNDSLVTNEEIKDGFLKSKLTMFGTLEQFISPKGFWNSDEYKKSLDPGFIQYAKQILAMKNDEPFFLDNKIIAKASYWKMWFLDDVSVLDRLSNYQGKIIYMNGDIDSQTPGIRELNILNNHSRWMRNRPKFKLYKGIGHCFGTDVLLGPIQNSMVREIYKSLEELE